MEFEFDKEMDAMLRQMAKGEESAFATKNPQSAIRNPHLEHLDTDEISAFAENALPNKARTRVTKHLADCDSCRVSLSNLIVLNSEANAEETPAPIAGTSETQTASGSIPWYQKLFDYKNLAYGLGALVILFAGFTTYIVFQNVNNSADGEIARINENSSNIAETPAQTESSDTAKETDYDANITVANQAPNAGENNTADSDSTDEKQILNEQEESPSDNQPTVGRRNDEVGLVKKPKSVGTPTTGSYVEAKPVVKSPSRDITAADAEGSKDIVVAGEPAKTEVADSKVTTDRNAPFNVRKGETVDQAKEKKKDIREEDADDDKNKLSSRARKNIGGKTFTRTNNRWVDTAYKGQKTTNVRRGTNEYQKLDSGLRSIGNQLSGTVVVVWKTKAYKIQ